MRANEVRPYGKYEKARGKERDAGDSVPYIFVARGHSPTMKCIAHVKLATP